jgi:cytochrome c-type biogenesis protein
VIDLLGEGLRAVATRSVLAYPVVFAAGAVTGVGPCAAPRFVAVAALAGAARRPRVLVAAFAAGVAGAYVALGFAAEALGALWSLSAPVYLVLASAFGAGALVTLLRPGGHSHGACTEHRPAHPGGASLGAAFLLGASSVAVVAPCCTPMIAAIAGLTLGGGRAADGALLLAAFACGHVLPVLCIGALGSRLADALGPIAESGAPAVVAGGLMLALAAYYGVLA